MIFKGLRIPDSFSERPCTYGKGIYLVLTCGVYVCCVCVCVAFGWMVCAGILFVKMVYSVFYYVVDKIDRVIVVE